MNFLLKSSVQESQSNDLQNETTWIISLKTIVNLIVVIFRGYKAQSTVSVFILFKNEGFNGSFVTYVYGVNSETAWNYKRFLKGVGFKMAM